MKTADEWFAEYGVSHQNATNKFIHWICVPAIFISVIGLLASIPHAWMDSLFPAEFSPWINYGAGLLLLASIFYLRLSAKLFVGLFAFYIFSLWLVVLTEEAGLPLALGSFIIFTLAWIGQFIGHKIEGAKPSFFKDLQFLLIGPAWLMHFIYKKLGISY